MRIAVLGYAGSGKTFVSDYLSQKKSIPVLHLDSVKYNKEWQPIDNELVLSQVMEFMERKDWIIDGFYKYLLMEERLEKADLIIILCLPRLLCLLRTIQRKKKREQAGYKNDVNWWFIKFTLFGCRNKERRQVYTEIEQKYKEKVVILKNKHQVDLFLKSMN